MVRPLLRRSLALAVCALLLAAALPALAADVPAQPAAVVPLMPDFRHHEAAAWLYSAPLDWKHLRGKVVLVDLFTSS